ncbi:MAG: glycosyltransferase family 2 protein [Clostridia bacterium]|nr:glycosyltransferase family 2 protein [Clostridia bacterium]
MEQMPLVSIIVPVYNVEKYLERCIKSVLSQTYPNIELILVDDGSKDSSPQICDSYADRENITVIHKENGGLSSARNAGIKRATGEYIFFLDSDDFIHDECIQTLYDIMTQCDCDIVQGNFERGTLDFFADKVIKEEVELVSYQEALLGFRYKTLAWGKLYRRFVIDDVEFPEGLIHEDEAVYYQYACRAKKIAITNRALYYYFMAPNSIMRNNQEYKNECFIDILEERIEFFENRNEPLMVRASIERYLVILVLTYSEWHCSKTIQNDEKKLRSKFLEFYKRLKGFSGTPIKLKLMFLAFRICPNLSARVIALIRK